jgi:hypothetical protein
MEQQFASRFKKKDGTQSSEGFLTPKEIDTVQRHGFMPERAIPIIFLPGILASNLRIKDQKRQNRLEEEYGRKKGDKIAWQPDAATSTLPYAWKSAAERQLTLDRRTVEVDTFDYPEEFNGGAVEWGYIRRNGVEVESNSPILRPYHVRAPGKHGPPYIAVPAEREACLRGWGEVMFGAYGNFLNRLERAMNAMFSHGKPTPEWKSVVGVDPRTFGLVTENLPPIDEDDLRQIAENCFFPVHAIGYNWIQDCGISGREVARRIEKIMASYLDKKILCEKVIVVTHSCGGLVSRALCHPKYGNFEEKVLGVVYGEQPAIGAAAAYYRMLGGWEPADNVKGKAAAWALGDEGPEVTVMLANGPGGMELLPFKEYGNGWLQIKDAEGKVLRSLPEKGDPYEEIYTKTSDEVWWGLLRPKWINPAKLKEDEAGLKATRKLLKEKVRPLHEAIASYYHPVSYAHYGVDPQRLSFQTVAWEVGAPIYQPPGRRSDRISRMQPNAEQVDRFPVVTDKGDKKIVLGDTTLDEKEHQRLSNTGAFQPGLPRTSLLARLLPPVDPGDQTVPVHSADHQYHSKRPEFEGVFRLMGYEHQDSYKDIAVQNATLYSIVQIAREMKWSGE